MKTRKYEPDEIIIAEGTHGDQTFLITEGQVEICKETGKGRIRIALLSVGEVFGEMYLFDDTGFRTASVVARTAVSVEVISREEIQESLAATPAIVMSIMRTLSTRLAQTSQENSLLKYKSDANPLARLLRKFTG